MTAKTKKELQAENVLLKEELAEIKTKFKKLTEKYKNVQQHKQIPTFQCQKCSKNFQSSEDFKKHMIEHRQKGDTFSCDLCGSEFTEEWKMLAHKKNHTKFNCEKCDKKFKYQVIKEKHMSISHGNKILYCHYFNNRKKCPFEENCIFIHDDSDMCRYGSNCERNLCMYKHSYEEDDIIGDNDTNVTFQNPYISDKFECDFCDFNTTDKKEFELHLDEIKRICPICKKDYDCVDWMKEHLEADH